MVEKYYALPGVEREVSQGDLERALGRLRVSERQKDFFRMAFYDEMTNAQIAEQEGLSRGYVKTARSRVLCLVRAYLD